MKAFTSQIFAIALAACAIVLANCSGSTTIPAGNPGTSPTPTANPTATPTATPTPTPSPSPTAFACTAPPPDPNTTAIPILGTGPAQVVTVPCYNDFTGTATIPADTTISGPTNADISVTSDSGAFTIPDDPTAGTRLLSTAISVTANITLGNSAIPTTVTSPSKIVAGQVYEAELYLFNGFSIVKETNYFQLGLIPAGHSISFNVVDPAGTVFLAGAVAYVIIYQNNPVDACATHRALCASRSLRPLRPLR